MPFTDPLAPLPSSYPNAQAPIVDKDGKPTPEFYRLIVQLRSYLKPADAALRQVEP